MLCRKTGFFDQLTNFAQEIACFTHESVVTGDLDDVLSEAKPKSRQTT